MGRLRIVVGLFALSLAGGASAQIDPLTVTVDERAAQHFAELWRATDGKPAASQIQDRYLRDGGRAVEVFTPGRIRSAEHLAKTVAQHSELYRDAVERCLPWVAATNVQLRSTYLGLKGLLPKRDLPAIAVVIGANNSGGTAGPNIQVIGLEVICRLSPTRAAFEDTMRQFFAHETIHTLQSESAAPSADPLLAAAIGEGVPDYIAKLVTARVPNPERDSRPARTRTLSGSRSSPTRRLSGRARTPDGKMTPEAKRAFHRWFANAGDPPPGWPDELGYCVGMRIAEGYVAAAANPHAAVDELIEAKDPAMILRQSRYGTGL